MTKRHTITPFHTGERAAQQRAGVGDVAQWASGFIRDYLPEQHREFHSSLPFLILAGADSEGRTWVSIVESKELEHGSGFICSPDPYSILIEGCLNQDDPLFTSFTNGAEVGVLGIELESRRRNRFSGYIRPEQDGYSIQVRQTFGNCPQYIHPRRWTRVPPTKASQAIHSTALNTRQIDWIETTDTLFIGSGQLGATDTPSNGYDASHRGGEAGFVKVVNAKQLRLPDYAGNNFFNTIGNLLLNPSVGLLLVEFETGSVLHITGRASIDWNADNSHDPQALRMITIDIDEVIEQPNVLTLRWDKLGNQVIDLKLIKRKAESSEITSFYFVSADGRSLPPFVAGQYLPIEVTVPNKGQLTRNYSLSGSSHETSQYRISVKRETKGIVSGFLHDELTLGATIKAQVPAGEFQIPDEQSPLVLVSAGVGLTPMLAMLHDCVLHESSNRPVWFIHGTRNGQTHAMVEEVKHLLANHPHIKQRIYYSRPVASDKLGHDYHVQGRIIAEDLLALDAGENVHYMLCGPAPFLTDMIDALKALGVPEGQLHIESFGLYVAREEWFIHELEKGVQAADEGRLIDHDNIKAKWEAKHTAQID